MKLNWKALIPIAVIAVALVWGFISVQTSYYSDTNVDFVVGSGMVIVTNTSDSPVPVQLVSQEPATFAVFSDMEGVSGQSIVQGSGRTATQLFEFVLPAGVSEFRVARGADIHFVADSDDVIEATVHPFRTEDTTARLTIAAIAIVVSLFYLSHLNGHRWISASRRQKAVDLAAAQKDEQKNFERIFGSTSFKK